MMAKLRYVGTYKRKITWNSMGECFSYTIYLGDVIHVPASQMNNARGFAPFEVVPNGKKKKKTVGTVRKIFEKESSEVITAKDEKVFQKQDKLDPFEKYEKDGWVLS